MSFHRRPRHFARIAEKKSPELRFSDYQGIGATLAHFLESARTEFIARGKGRPAQHMHYFVLRGLREGWESLPEPILDTRDFVGVVWKPGAPNFIVDVEGKDSGQSSTFTLTREGALASYNEDVIELSGRTMKISQQDDFTMRDATEDTDVESRKAMAFRRATVLVEALVKCGELVKMTVFKNIDPSAAGGPP